MLSDDRQGWPTGAMSAFVIAALLLAGAGGMLMFPGGTVRADGGNNIILSTYTVSGTEVWNDVRVMGLGKLVVPQGAWLNADNIYLEPGSKFELSGGTVLVTGTQGSDHALFTGRCDSFTVSSGSNLTIAGPDGISDMEHSRGVGAVLDVTAAMEVTITGSEVGLSGGDGTSPTVPWSQGDLGGNISAGGAVLLSLAVNSSTGPFTVRDSTIVCAGGAGGDAPSGGRPRDNTEGVGGGFTRGGNVTGRVGGGGGVRFMMDSAWKMTLEDSTIDLACGPGGDAGHALDIAYGPQAGAGGGGYSGGDGSPGLSHSRGSPGGTVSGRTGAGGGTIATMTAVKKLTMDRMSMRVQAGDGGDAGQGGTSEAGGAGGGGGYSGGGGGSYYHGAGGFAGDVLGDVGRGGDVSLEITAQNVQIHGSAVTAMGGTGGSAGDGGGLDDDYTYNGGHGGGGYAGGGGGGQGSGTGEHPGADGGAGGNVSGYTGAGGNATLAISAGDLGSDSAFSLLGGDGGDAGVCGPCYGHWGCFNGAGGFSAGGSGGSGLKSAGEGNGGAAGMVKGHVGDGGNVVFDVECTGECAIQTISLSALPGTGGDGNASQGPDRESGKSAGRTTSDGAMALSIPVDIAPVILAVPPLTAMEDAAYRVEYKAYDVETATGDLEWEGLTIPSFLDFDARTAVLTGTPGDNDIGQHTVSISVTDASGLRAHSNFTLEVINVNDPPVITTMHPGVCRVEELFEVRYNATDPDPTGDTLNWSLTTDAHFLAIDEDTGLLAGTPGRWDDGTYSVNVTVTDDSGASHSDLFTLRVLEPWEDLNVSYAGMDVDIQEDGTGVLELESLFTDRVGENLTYTVTGGTNVTWTLVNGTHLHIIPDPDWSGTDTLTLYADNGQYRTDRPLEIYVEPVNDPPRDVTITFERRVFYEDREQRAWGDAYDPDVRDGDRLSFRWYVDGYDYIGSGQYIDLDLPAGNHQVTLIVEDEWGLSGQTTRGVDVLGGDDPPPPPPDDGIDAFLVAVLLIIVVLILFGVFMGINMSERGAAEGFAPAPEGPPDTGHYGGEVFTPADAYMSHDDWGDLRAQGPPAPGTLTDVDDDEERGAGHPAVDEDMEDGGGPARGPGDDGWESEGIWDDDDWEGADGYAIDDRETPRPRYPDQMASEFTRTRGDDWDMDDHDGDDRDTDDDGGEGRGIDDDSREDWDDDGDVEVDRDLADPGEEDWDAVGTGDGDGGRVGAPVVDDYADTRRPPAREVHHHGDRDRVDGSSSRDGVWDPEEGRRGTATDREGDEAAEPFRTRRRKRVVKVRRREY